MTSMLAFFSGMDASSVLVIFLIFGVWALLKAIKDFSTLSLKSYSRANSIVRPPGSSLLKIADFFHSPKSMELTYLPMVADLQKEYFDALAKGRKYKALMIRISYFWRFLHAMGISQVLNFIRSFRSAKLRIYVNG